MDPVKGVPIEAIYYRDWQNIFPLLNTGCVSSIILICKAQSAESKAPNEVHLAPCTNSNPKPVSGKPANGQTGNLNSYLESVPNGLKYKNR